MGYKKIIIGLIIALIAVSSLLAFTDRKIEAQEGDSDPEVSKKLDEVLKNQKEILQEIASIKESLEVIKIRVTR